MRSPFARHAGKLTIALTALVLWPTTTTLQQLPMST